MSPRPEAPDPTRPGLVGTLLLRVWMENDTEGSLRIRLVGRSDVESDEEELACASTVEESVALTRSWLRRFPPLVASTVTEPDPDRRP